jgi:hypothetical protein
VEASAAAERAAERVGDEARRSGTHVGEGIVEEQGPGERVDEREGRQSGFVGGF